MHSPFVLAVFASVATSALAAPVHDKDDSFQATQPSPEVKRPGWANALHPHWMAASHSTQEEPTMPTSTEAHMPVAMPDGRPAWCEFSPHAPACFPAHRKPAMKAQVAPSPTDSEHESRHHYPHAWCESSPHAPVCFPHFKGDQDIPAPKTTQDSAIEPRSPKSLYNPPVPTAAQMLEPRSPKLIWAASMPTTFQTTANPTAEASVKTTTYCPAYRDWCATITYTEDLDTMTESSWSEPTAAPTSVVNWAPQ